MAKISAIVGLCLVVVIVIVGLALHGTVVLETPVLTVRTEPASVAEVPTPALVPKLELDPTEVAELQVYLTRCSDGVAEACNSAAIRIGDGVGAPVDFEKSAALYEKACELGSGVGCRNFARRLKLGKGAPVDLERAKTFYDRACKLNYELACKELEAL